jgi:hypothetical protein
MNLPRASLLALLVVSISGCQIHATFRGVPAPHPVDAPASPPIVATDPPPPDGMFAIRYDHFVDGRFNGHVDFQPNQPGGDEGTMTNDSGGVGTWKREGRRLVMTWPTDNARGGAWIDAVELSRDSASYAGRNNVGSMITGLRNADPIVTRPRAEPVGEATVGPNGWVWSRL